MGACLVTQKIKGDKDTVGHTFRAIQDQCRYDYGHSGYTGTFAEKTGITYVPMEMTEAEAEDYIADNNDKWGNAHAVKLSDEEDTWLVGGWCSE